MSGIEIIGLAASVLQIAELGGKLSLKLYTFTRKIKDADKNIDALSRDIAVTGNVLRELGDSLSKESSARVCSKKALDTAAELVGTTSDVFAKLEKIVDGGEQAHTSRLRKGISIKQRLKFVVAEGEIEQAQANLERLKSSLLVILNVLIFAQQMKSNDVPALLEDQKDLIRTLVAEKDASVQRYENLMRAIELKSSSSKHRPEDGSDASSSLLSLNSSSTTLVGNGSSASWIDPSQKSPVDLPPALKRSHERITQHTSLVHALLQIVDSSQFKVDHSARGRLLSGVLDVHWDEWETQRTIHGFEAVQGLFVDYEEIAQYWDEQRLTQTLQSREPMSGARSRPSIVDAGIGTGALASSGLSRRAQRATSRHEGARQTSQTRSRSRSRQRNDSRSYDRRLSPSRNDESKNPQRLASIEAAEAGYSVSAPLAGFESEQQGSSPDAIEENRKGYRSRISLGTSPRLATRHKYLFETDSEEEEEEEQNVLDADVKRIHATTNRLHTLGAALGAEVSSQNSNINRIAFKNDRIGGSIAPPVMDDVDILLLEFTEMSEEQINAAKTRSGNIERSTQRLARIK